MNTPKSLLQKKNLLMALIFLMVGSTLFSCSTKQKTVQKTDDASVVISYEKERSRGNKLPLYSLEVMDNKMIRYTGKANVPNMGEHLIELQNAQYKEIMKVVEGMEFEQLNSSYKGKLRDLPLTSITYKGHKVTYQQAACPDKLQALATLLEEFNTKT